MSKRVKAPLVIARDAEGRDVYLYQGASLPSGLKEGEADRLAEFLEDVDEVGADGGAPAKSASKAEWEAYARSQGATDEDLEGQTKDDLVAAYGS